MTAPALRSRRWDIFLWSLLAVCIGRLWLMKIASSFWIDEIVTAFVVRFGPAHPSLAVAPQVSESIYYWLPRAAQRMFGFSEIAYRIPSAAVMGVALFLMARLAMRLIHPSAGWFAVFACLAMRGISYEAIDARPYALGIAVGASSMWFLVRWLDSARWIQGLLFVLFATLVWRVHLAFWPFYLILVLYAAVRIASSRSNDRTAVTWWKAVVIFALLGLSLVPVLETTLSLFRHAAAHVIVAPPTFRDLRRTLRLGLMLECDGGAVLLGLLFHRLRNRQPLSQATLALIGGWWLGYPLAIFVFSRVTGDVLFVDRYLSIALPGVALAATFLASRFLPDQFWEPAAAVLGLGVLCFLGQWQELRPRHDLSDWRGAARSISELAPDIPVICPSPFIEAKPPSWTPDYPLPSFLYSHLAIYPIGGTPYRFPFQVAGQMPPEGSEYAASLSGGVLPRSPRFMIYGDVLSVRDWRIWLQNRPELAGWRNQELGPFGNVSVVKFER